MTDKRNRHTKEISITGALYDRVRALAKARGTTMPAVVEPLILQALNEGWMPTGDRVVPTPTASGQRALRDRVNLEVPRAIYEMVDDQVIRARELAGKTVTHDALFESALQAALAAEGA